LGRTASLLAGVKAGLPLADNLTALTEDQSEAANDLLAPGQVARAEIPVPIQGGAVVELP
jgi:hypothetical protein